VVRKDSLPDPLVRRRDSTLRPRSGIGTRLVYKPPNSGQKKDLVQALGLITAGVAGAVGIYFTWRGQRLTRQAQEENQWNTLQQLEQTRNEYDLSRRGQITERFTRAIDQLGKTDDEGNKLFEIRLGGIYALERIARESEEDYWPIMEVLTAYVRQHARWLQEEVQEGTEDAAVENKSREDSRGESKPTERPTPDPDIQAIMTVLRRRTRSLGHGEPEPLHLHETNLSGANLRGAVLTEADLSGANLSGADLAEVDLTRAHLTGADLTGAADLSGANLSGTFLRQANLSGADLSGANLSGAYLMRAHLTGAVLTKEQLQLAKSLEGATMPDGQILKGDTNPNGPTFEEWHNSRGEESSGP
jgi:hypothetical protein